MTGILNLYLDDSGTRNPDRHVVAHKRAPGDWFALGGVIVSEDGEHITRQQHGEFCARWNMDYPLHSVEIRGRTRRFSWLEKVAPERRDAFFNDLTELVLAVPLTGIACVIDRPGYQERYLAQYGRNRWSLCKTAFCVVVERALKYAISKNCKLRVYVERASKKDDDALASYYRELMIEGNPFSNISAKYAPLQATDYAAGLKEFKPKNKTSPMLQFADLYLYPICRAGYETEYRPHVAMKQAGRIIDCLLTAEEVLTLGVKYSCFGSDQKMAA